MTANLTKRPRALKAGVRRFSAAALMSAVGAIPDYAFAQAQQAAESEPASTESDIAAGLDLWVDAATTFSDNIFATQNDKAADFIFSLEPGAKLSIGGKSAGVTIRGEGEVARYDRNTGEDYDDWSASVETRARISRDFLLIGGGEYQWEHESRTSPDDANGSAPTQYERGYAFGAALIRSGAFYTRIGATIESFEFSDTEFTAGSINNADRDRLQIETGARAGVDVSKGLSVFIQGAQDRREYDSELDDFGFDRDSNGYSAAAGLRRVFSPSVSGEIYGGVIHRNYRDASLPTINTFDIGAELKWKAPEGLSGSFQIDRRIEETTLPGASAYILTSGALSASLSPHPRLSSGLSLTGAHFDYEGVDRSEFIVGVNAWTKYWLSRRLFAGVDYNFAQRTSSAAGFDFSENRLTARLGAQLSPRDFAGAGALSDFIDATAPGGLYLAAFGTYGALTTGLDGPRGSGTNTADFGDSGLGYGGAVGYGVVVKRLYLGVELEGTSDSARWSHLSGREFSANKANGFGGGVRVGYVTDRHDLFYGRFGVVSSEFETRYVSHGAAVEEHERERGLGFGVGLEAQDHGRGFMKVEYAVASYDDYDIATGSSTFDNFANIESQFRFGVGLRTGVVDDAGDTEPVKFSGPYAGVQLGHGALVSRNEGVRSGGAPLNVTRGAHGPLAGAFAGAGATISRLYVGVEADVDVSDIDWNIERDPGGRIYSAEHEYSFGAGARIGVLLGGSSLVYSRIGAAWTRFATDFETDDATVKSRLTRTGLRIGGGLETGLTPRARLRLDYTYTKYPEYEVEYGSSIDTFRNSEVLFRLGVLRSL